MIKETFVVYFLMTNGTFEGSLNCAGKSEKDYSCKHVIVARKEIKNKELLYVLPTACGKDFVAIPAYQSYLWKNHRMLPFPKVSCKMESIEGVKEDQYKITMAKGSW